MVTPRLNQHGDSNAQQTKRENALRAPPRAGNTTHGLAIPNVSGATLAAPLACIAHAVTDCQRAT